MTYIYNYGKKFGYGYLNYLKNILTKATSNQIDVI